MEELLFSKGNQGKWKSDEIWYKADCLGYESLAEHVISKLLIKTNMANFVNYDITVETKNDEELVCCQSHDFLPNDHTKIVTLDHLFDQYLHEDITTKCLSFDEVFEGIMYVVDEVEKITGLKHFGEYLTAMLEMDALFQNEDRHFNNIAVLYDSNSKTFSYAPIFDNGASLYSDTICSFPMDMNVEQCEKEIRPKPFGRTFDEQIEAAEYVYKKQLEYTFTMDDVRSCLQEIKDSFPGIYSDKVYERVEQTLEIQLQKYHCFQKGATHKSFDSEKLQFRRFATDYAQLETKMVSYMQSHPEGNVSYSKIPPEYVRKVYRDLIRANIPFVGRVCEDQSGLFVVQPQDERLLLKIQEKIFDTNKEKEIQKPTSTPLSWENTKEIDLDDDYLR